MIKAMRTKARNVLIAGGACAAVLAATASPAAAGPLPPQGPNPDEWHCGLPVNQNGDRICLRLNQFLGWWTGFNTAYHRVGTNSSTLRVKLYWSSTEREGGTFPAGGGEFVLGEGEDAKGDSWADLPRFACIEVWSRNTLTTGSSYITPRTTVCRNN